MLTSKQKSMLMVLIDHLEAHDVPPSFEELCLRLDLKSKSGIHRLLTGLEERGYIRRLHNRARAIEVLKYPDGSPFQQTGSDQAALTRDTATAEATAVPLLGKIAAGTPIAAISDPTSHLPVPPGMIGQGEYYALQIEGDSMIEAGILDGDTVLIERRDTAQTGEIVVALVDGEEATLKRLRRKGDSIALEAANKDYETRIFGPDQVQIQGRLAGLIRSY
ncbi:MAG: transcriptional repressor LexA [Candidatus Puniceispirillales bacterium]